MYLLMQFHKKKKKCVLAIYVKCIIHKYFDYCNITVVLKYILTDAVLQLFMFHVLFYQYFDYLN